MGIDNQNSFTPTEHVDDPTVKTVIDSVLISRAETSDILILCPSYNVFFHPYIMSNDTNLTKNAKWSVVTLDMGTLINH